MRTQESSPSNSTSMATSDAPASMELSTRSATAAAKSYPISRSDVISRRAPGITSYPDLPGIGHRAKLTHVHREERQADTLLYLCKLDIQYAQRAIRLPGQ